MRAVSEDKDTAALMGVNVNRTISSTFFIGSALAGIAGVMVGLFYLQIRVDMGFVPGIKAFTSAVLGGIGSIPGAMIGGYVLGLVEVLSIQVLPAVYKDVVAFVVLILTLHLPAERPAGEPQSPEEVMNRRCHDDHRPEFHQVVLPQALAEVDPAGLAGGWPARPAPAALCRRRTCGCALWAMPVCTSCWGWDC